MTISLPKEMRRQLTKAAKADGTTQSEFVRRAVKIQLFRSALRAAYVDLVPKARALGIYTDEDVFNSVS